MKQKCSCAVYIVSEIISTIFSGPSFPWSDTERLFPSAVAAAQVREGYTDVKYEVRHDITTDTAAPESSSTICPDDE